MIGEYGVSDATRAQCAQYLSSNRESPMKAWERGGPPKSAMKRFATDPAIQSKPPRLYGYFQAASNSILSDGVGLAFSR